MRSISRALAVILVATAISVDFWSVPASAARCWIDNTDYYEDETCTSMTGSVARGCNGQILWSWGTQSAYWNQQVDGGDGICGCGGEDYNYFNPGTCPPPSGANPAAH